MALVARGHAVIATTETEAQAAALRAEAPSLRVEKLDITGSDIDKVRGWDIDVLIDNAGARQTGPLVDVPIMRSRRWAKTLRAELAGQGVDVTLLNPGPYLTGFNDAMVDSMWEWFGEASLNAPAKAMFQTVGSRVKTGQLDPADVVQRIVELVEADKTSENSFMPPDILQRLGARRSG